MTETQKSRVRVWIKALRSGKYRQRRGTLKKNEEYCCLGVACEVYRNATGFGRWEPIHGTEANRFVVGRDHHSATLPDSVRKWFGLTNRDPSLVVSGEFDSATGHNDKRNRRFPSIAKGLERLVRES